MTGTKCDLFTHNQSRSYLNHPVFALLKNENNYFLRNEDKEKEESGPC